MRMGIVTRGIWIALLVVGMVLGASATGTMAQTDAHPPPDIQGVWDLHWQVNTEKTTCPSAPGDEQTNTKRMIISQSGSQVEVMFYGADDQGDEEPGLALQGQATQDGDFSVQASSLWSVVAMDLTAAADGNIISGKMIVTTYGDASCIKQLDLVDATRTGDAPTHTVCARGCDYKTIQDAVDAATPGDIIKIAAGTYTGVQDRDGAPQLVLIDKSLVLRGGYAPDNWAVPDPVTNQTTLDAQGKGRVLLITGVQTTTNVMLTGMTITGGNAQGLGGYKDMGKGRQPDGIGGGIFAISTTLTLADSAVINNQVLAPNEELDKGFAGYGGGLALISCKALVRNSTISDNSSQDGGGVFSLQSSTTWFNNTISNNSALSDKPGKPQVNSPYGYGGGMTLLVNGLVILHHNTIISNTADLNGGGVLIPFNFAPVIITGNTIEQNRSYWIGGGGVIDAGPPEITGDGNHVVFDGNTLRGNTSSYGGGFMFTRAKGSFTNNIFAENEAEVQGSGIIIQASMANFTNNTFARHTSGDGTGVYVNNLDTNLYPPGDAPSGLFTSTVALTNTILVSNTVGITVEQHSTAELNTTLWGSGVWANTARSGGKGAIVTRNDVAGDPSFLDPDAGNYHIGTTSAARNKGVAVDVKTDIDGEPLLFKQDVDMGADQILCTSCREVQAWPADASWLMPRSCRARLTYCQLTQKKAWLWYNPFVVK